MIQWYDGFNSASVRWCAGCTLYNAGDVMVRYFRSAQQCLASVAGFDVAGLLQPGYGEVARRFLCGFHCLTVNVFWLYMSLAFCILICSLCSFCVDKWLLRAIALWTIFAWKSGRQQGQEAAVSWNSATIFLQALFVRKKEGNQTTHGCILAVSFILGISGLQICFFSQPNSGNCNLSVLMVFPLGPAFIIPYIWFLHRFLSSPIPYIVITILIFSCWTFLVSWLGLWDFPFFDCRCLQERGGWKKSVKFLRKLSQLTKHDLFLSKPFKYSKQILHWILGCPHPRSWG